MCGGRRVTSVEQVSISEEIRASAAAHRDLGPGYDGAVAEGLVERIGDEIDRRVDARLISRMPYTAPQPQPEAAQPRRRGRSMVPAVFLAFGSMAFATGTTAEVLHPGWQQGNLSGGAAFLTALIWIVIAVVNIVFINQR